MNLIASPTVWIPSDFSSGIEIPNSFSNQGNRAPNNSCAVALRRGNYLSNAAIE